MNYKPNPLLYGATEDFYSSFKLVVTMSAEVDHAVLSKSVAKAMKRYPYFSIFPKREGESIVLESNESPVPVFPDGRCVTLGSEECGGHLLAFGCEGNRIFLNASHYIADGMGIVHLLKTVLYLYVSELYGTEGLLPERIDMPDDSVSDEEYAYPFYDEPAEIDTAWLPKEAPKDVYSVDHAEFDGGGLYAYHLRIPQRAMMAKANPSDGSPISFLSVMLYKAFCSLDENIGLPVVAHVQHQYRLAIKAPKSRHSLVSYIPVMLPAKAKDWHVERQNTVVRGQIIIGSEPDAVLNAVNRLVRVLQNGESMSLCEKQQAMRDYIDSTVCGKTFGISYVGKMDWNGLDKYVTDMHAYIGEKNAESMIIIEVMTIGEDFTVNFMQSGKGERYVNAFAEQLRSFGIPVSIIGGERYTLCDTVIPR